MTRKKLYIAPVTIVIPNRTVNPRGVGLQYPSMASDKSGQDLEDIDIWRNVTLSDYLSY